MTHQTHSAIRGDISKLGVDAIVNAANRGLWGGSGVCGAIFNAAGYEDMTNACQQIGYCEYGETVITPGFKLPAKWVIHTVGPIYGQHNGNEREILYSCYYSSMVLADDKSLTSIAFPLISTGTYGYPKSEACQVAVEAINDYLSDNVHCTVEKVIFVAHSDDDLEVIKSKL